MQSPPYRERSPASACSLPYETWELRRAEPQEEMARLQQQLSALERERRASLRLRGRESAAVEQLEQDLEELQCENLRLRAVLADAQSELERARYALGCAEESARPPGLPDVSAGETAEELQRTVAAQERELRDLALQLERAESTDDQLLAQQRKHTGTKLKFRGDFGHQKYLRTFPSGLSLLIWKSILDVYVVRRWAHERVNRGRSASFGCMNI